MTVLPPADVEKAPEVLIAPRALSSDLETNTNTNAKNPLLLKLQYFNEKIESLSGLEIRGISRVPPEERHLPSRWDDISVGLLWFSANISVNNLAVGLLGPLVFGLGFLDCAMCAVFGALLGSVSTGYMSIWGPQSGNRTMVCVRTATLPPHIRLTLADLEVVLRYFMGYWPAKIPTFLNIVLMVR
jgi:hypothetical protein